MYCAGSGFRKRTCAEEMFQIHWILVLELVVISHSLSWDVAITAGNELQFFSKGNKVSSVGGPFISLAGLTYDTVYDNVYFVDSTTETASIYSYHIGSEAHHTIVDNAHAFIHDLAFDPVTERLFWTDSVRQGVYWKSVASPTDDFYGNILISYFKNEEYPLAIAVDSCTGYVYWTNWAVDNLSTIERVRFDGSERKIIVNNLEFTNSLIIDQQTKTLYFLDTTLDEHYTMFSSDLEGGNLRTLLTGFKNVPVSLTVSKQFIYWVDDWAKHIWRITKPTQGMELGQFASIHRHLDRGAAIVSNYGIFEQTEGIQECRALRSLAENKFCVHGSKVADKMACDCFLGYTGKRCEVSSCHNYCINGNCTTKLDGQPECICHSDFTGARCNEGPSYSNNTNKLRSIHCLHMLVFTSILQLLPAYIKIL